MDETPLHEPVSVISEDEVAALLAGVKDYLREAARANTVLQDQDRPLTDGVYTVSESDVKGLLSYILETAGQLRKKGTSQGVITTAKETESSSSQAPRSMRPVASTTVSPATTITNPEASFTPAIDTDDGVRERPQTATTSTVISQDNVTEITWLHPRDSSPVVVPEVETTLDPPSPGSPPSSADQPKHAETARTREHLGLAYSERRASVGSRSDATYSYRPESSIGNNTRKRRQSSMMVFTEGDELDPEGGPPTSLLSMVRKKSVQFGQAMGSLMNGAYRNADHKPRRDSSVVRMRGILDRIQPSMPRPEDDLDIYTAFTGAQPVTPIDQYNSRTRRPERASDGTCSEDGRLHKCVHHETGPLPC